MRGVFIYEQPIQLDIPLPAPTRAQPRGLVSLGKEALTKALTENKPIFLSIGYAACHWYHVMVHESFEDTETAAFMNEYFIKTLVHE